MATDTIDQPDIIRSAVRERYGSLARQDDEAGQEENCRDSSVPAARARCGGNVTTADYSAALGYSTQEQAVVPSGSNLGFGCGNPIAAAMRHLGDVVLYLGSGAGFDCFLAAAEVGPTGKVIGVDMTSDMLLKAAATPRKASTPTSSFTWVKLNTCRWPMPA